MFLNSFNYFRAIAILLIVAVHSYEIAGINIYNLNFFEKLAVNLISGGTTLFVFISGFLFHHIFLSKFSYLKFIKSKFQNVFVPYFFLTLPYIFVNLLGYGNSKFFDPTHVGILDKYIYPILKYYLSGATMAYWYIPFIMVMFLLSPLHVAFARTKTKIQIIVLIILLFISSIVQRPIETIYVLHNVIYFFPVYLIGIFCSINREKIYQLFANKEFVILIVVCFLATLNAWNGNIGNTPKDFFVYSGFDIVLFQKLLLSLFFMVFLHRFEKVQVRFLEYIAAVSFSIFFLHGYLISIFKRYYLYINQDSFNLFNLPAWLNLIFVVFFIASIITVFAISLKKLIPKYSKYLIGY
ncbi:Acyltransferase 3 [Methylophilaceae bacterium]